MIDNLMEDMTAEEALEYEREEQEYMAAMNEEEREEYYEFRRQEAELASPTTEEDE